ncbi:MAG: ATPase domain-containing protein [Thermoplasmatota archaeon]
MLRIGVRPFDERMRGLPEGSSVLFISSPGLDPTPFGIHAVNSSLREPGRAVYLVNNKPPSSVRREAELMGHDLRSLEDEGRLCLVDSYSAYSGRPSDERYVVQDPFNPARVLETLECARAAGSVVLIDSMSSYMDMHGDGLEEFLGVVRELKRSSSVMVLFSTWDYDPECVRRVKSEFETVLTLRPMQEISMVRQFIFAEKIGTALARRLAVPVKVLKPGGVRVYFPKVLVTGPHRSGKSTLVRAMSTSAVSVDRMGTTIAMDHGYLDFGGFACDLYGTPGQELFDPILATLAEEAVAVVLVIDAGDVGSFERARTMMRLTHAHSLPLIVAANHHDRESALGTDKIRAKLMLPGEVPIIPTVATEGRGVPELLEALVDKLMEVAEAEARREEGGA